MPTSFVIIKPDDPEEWPGWSSEFDKYIGKLVVVDVSIERETENGRKYYTAVDLNMPDVNTMLKFSSNWLVNLSNRLDLI